MAHISKSFGDVLALDNISFTLQAGEVRALVGENGAGKSTLMNILYGMYGADKGGIRLWGEEIHHPWSPREAIQAGIGMIHQHFALIPNHTVLENIIMPMLKWRDISPPWKTYERQVTRICQEYHFQINLKARVEDLSMGERQQVEILKALYQGARVLILDEPTSVLTPQQTDALLEFLLVLKSRGHSVVLVTHKLVEAMQVSDRITVLRGGKLIGTIERELATPQKIARMMVERDWITALKASPVPENSPVILNVRDLLLSSEQGTKVLDGVSLQVRAGEIVGVAGVAGNGQVELSEALVGLRKADQGTVEIDGVNITRRNVCRRRKAGLVYIPEDRHNRGVVLDMDIAENIVLNTITEQPYSRRGVLQPRAITACAEEAIEAYSIKTPGCRVPVGHLSGGNQQKIVMARAMLMNPKVIVACQPSRGLDFNATEYVRQQLIDCAKNGIGVLLVSSDLDEILELSHRILVIYRGKIVGVFPREKVDLDQLGLLMAGHGREK
jgi:simple sugar transport system ATP-binding protein